MSVSVSYSSNLTVTETLTDGLIAASSNSVSFSGANTAGTFIAGTSGTPCTKRGSAAVTGLVTLSTGAATIDLTALVGTGGAAVDGTGLKVQFAKFKNTAAAAMTIVGGASNGYLLFGASGSVIVPPGGEMLLKFSDGTPDIDATHKTLDITGTGSQAMLVEFVMG